MSLVPKPLLYGLLGFLLVILLAVITLTLRTPELDGGATSIDQRRQAVAQSVEALNLRDSALRNCVKSAADERARVPATSSGSIEDVSELKLLYCAGRGIRDISGLGQLSGLTILDISDNQITSLQPLHGHAHLTTLVARRNPLKNIEALAFLPSLQRLTMPDLPDFSCSKIQNITKGLISNASAIECARPRQSTLVQTVSEAAKGNNQLAGEKESTQLTPAQEEELFDYEREYRR